jgi:RNA polymerase sigma-70 factor (ECF subfamily)
LRLKEARAAWPEITLEERRFVAYLGERLPEKLDAVMGLQCLQVGDLYLACACAQGLPDALRAFEERILPAVTAALAPLGPEPFVAEAKQLLRHKLFVPDPGAPPKICEYGGRGPLARWARAVALRVALNLRRRRRTDGTPDDEALQDIPAPGASPELMLVRARHAAELKAAFEEALASLTVDERNLMRLHYLDGLTLDELAQVFRAHRATVARWLARCRETLYERVRARLSERLRLDPTELESVLGLVRSQLDLSIRRCLGGDLDGAEGR